MSNLIFEENDTAMEFCKNPWDSKAFDRDCYDLSIKLGATPPSCSSVSNFIKNNNLKTVTCRVKTTDFQLRRFVQYLDFSHVELQLYCRLILSDKMAPCRQLGNIRLASKDDRKKVQEIARNIFLNTRFRYIQDLPLNKIGTRFANWAGQLQDESPEFAYVLENNNEIIGFFYSRQTENKNELNAMLGGVSNECKGPYGYYLYPAVMNAYYNAGVRVVVSAIAADNLGALNLWAGLGTKFPQAVDIFMLNSTI